VPIEESGTVVEARDRTALVRLKRTSACSGCAAAGHCHAGQGEREQLLEARNDIGAARGDAVRVAVPARAVIGASARIYLLPVGGLLAGAAAAQSFARAFISAQAGDVAAGVGGIVGVVVAVLVGRRFGNRLRTSNTPLPRITGIVGGCTDGAGVDSPLRRG
jgi:sigma-E factor negative regulatory protein RseC